ncbi:lipid droplet-associated protein [Pseudonocardia yunnanensis]|uniref:Lipid droplet-associated protein n=1 Tax=Pseudonocardia yunnanensis TaxID=58107 RepID=A0ABW4F118_9PSEU
MSPLPLPVRLAAGLVATAVEQARDLPRLVVEFPVTAVSQALQASMRVQQKVTELAIKGDRALGTLRPVEERPAWAVFDDEEPMERNGASTVSTLHQRSARDAVVTLAAETAQPEAPVQTAAEVAAETAADTATPAAPERHAPAADTATGPNVLPGYRDLTIPQLRGRLRHLTVDDLQALLDWETAHDNRPPFVTMLSNRITTVNEG